MKEISLQMVDETNISPFKNFTVNQITYTFKHQIAKGHFSTIYEATDIWNNNLVVKIYTNKIDEEVFNNEIKQLKRFSSKYVVNLYEAFSYQEFHFLIMENFGVSISRVQTKDFDTKVQIFIECARSLLQTIHQIHLSGNIHGDINPQNVLLDIKNNQIVGVKICDFAFCRKADSSNKEIIGIAHWIIPPEYFEVGIGNLSSAIDVYHAALVLYSILCEKKLNYTKKEILNNKPQKDVLNSLNPLIKALSPALEINPEKRISAIELWKNLININK